MPASGRCVRYHWSTSSYITQTVLTGGAVQGSVLGVLDHNAVMEGVDDDFVSTSHKYVDDLTTTEKIGPGTLRRVDEEEDGTTVLSYHAIELQMNLESLMETCQTDGLKVNENKTQLLAISAEKEKKTRVFIKSGESTITSGDNMKLLGFVFSDRPNVNAQIRNLITCATKRVFVLRHYSTFMPGKDLIMLYCSLVRSILEYSSVTYNFLLTKTQENDLENVQKRCQIFFWLPILLFGVIGKIETPNFKNQKRNRGFKICP